MLSRIDGHILLTEFERVSCYMTACMMASLFFVEDYLLVGQKRFHRNAKPRRVNEVANHCHFNQDFLISRLAVIEISHLQSFLTLEGSIISIHDIFIIMMALLCW